MKSPMLRRHFAPYTDIDIHYPQELLSPRPVFKQLLIGKDGQFRAAIDVLDYSPEEISVKTVGHTILVEMRHGDKEDGFGTVARNYSKKFVLPPNMNMAQISSWTSKGVLYLKVPAIEAEKVDERIVEIKHEDPTKPFV